MKKVSIIIPVYNVAEYIERCVLSVLNQTYENIEIILIDDCSPDNSIKIARGVISAHRNGHKVTIHKHEKNKGLSAARNTGIDISTGDYLYFLDSDDDIKIDTIECLIHIAKKHSSPDFIIGDFKLVGETKNRILSLELSVEYIDDADEILKLFLEHKWYVMAWNKLVRADFLKQEKLYFKEGIVHEDVLWSIILANKAKSMGVLNQKTYNYYIRENSITTNISTKNLDSYLIIMDDLNKMIKNQLLDNNEYNLRYLMDLKKYLLVTAFSNTSISMNVKLKYFSFTKKCGPQKYFDIKGIGDILINIGNWLPDKIGNQLLNFYFCGIKKIF